MHVCVNVIPLNFVLCEYIRCLCRSTLQIISGSKTTYVVQKRRNIGMYFYAVRLIHTGENTVPCTYTLTIQLSAVTVTVREKTAEYLLILRFRFKIYDAYMIYIITTTEVDNA